MRFDDYGIPEGFFGPLAPELPALIGRVVMLSALLETKIWHLASSLGDGVQERYARERPMVNVNLTRSRILLYQENESEKQFSQSVTSLLADAERILDLRNAIVHGVWPESGLGRWMLWKPRPKKPKENEDWIVKIVFSRHELQEVVGNLVQLVQIAESVIAEAGSMPARNRLCN